MVYATQDSLIKRYSVDLLKTLAMTPERTLDETKVAEALEDASQTIDSYLAGRYALPLKTRPTVLERHCCYLARYFLEKSRATEQARKDYEDSIRWLEKVAAGIISLGISEAGETVESENIIIIESAKTVWGRDKSKGFI